MAEEAEKQKIELDTPEIIKGEMCPFCKNKTLTLMETAKDIPFFGICFIFSMDCSSDTCRYHKADVESAEEKPPCKFTIEVASEEDLKVRIVKSSQATLKLGTFGTIEPGEASNGYVTNVEGVLNRIKKQIEIIRDESDDDADRKKAKNHLKKLTRVLWGQDKCKIVLTDPSGNSAIISEKAVKG